MSLTKATRHSLIQGIGKVISTILGILALAIITRYLGQAGFGQYTKVMAFLQFFAIFIDMGLSLIMVQLISNPTYKEASIVNNLLTFRIISALIFLSLAPLTVLFFPYESIVKEAVFITTFSFFFIALTQVITGIFQKHLSMQYVAIAENIGRVILVVSIFLISYFDLGFLAIMTAVVLSSFIHYLVLQIASYRFICFKLSFDWPIWKLILQKTWPIALSIVFNLIYLKADIIILSLFHSDNDVGIYGAAYRVIEVLTVIPMMIMGLMLPLLSHAYATQNKEHFTKTIQHGFNVLSLLILPIVLGTLLLGDEIMTLIAGPEFALSGAPLKIIVFGLAAIFLGNVFAHSVIAIDKQKPMIWGYAITAFLALIGYIIFIPLYSYMAAAYITVFSEVLIALISLYMVYKTIQFSLSLRLFMKALISGLIMIFILYWIRDISLFILIPLGALIYFTALSLFKVISLELVKTLFLSK